MWFQQQWPFRKAKKLIDKKDTIISGFYVIDWFPSVNDGSSATYNTPIVEKDGFSEHAFAGRTRAVL
jgi:hypothetical protein